MYPPIRAKQYHMCPELAGEIITVSCPVFIVRKLSQESSHISTLTMAKIIMRNSIIK